jgi:hexosaminidase
MNHSTKTMTNKAYSLFLSTLLGLLIFPFFLSCEKEIPTDLTQSTIIPKPVSVSATGSSFKINETTGIYVQSNSEEVNQAASFLGEFLTKSTGVNLEVKQATEGAPEGSIVFDIVNDPELGDEGYVLDISKKQLKITANKPVGLFWGVQTIRQLLPPGIESGEKQALPLIIPTGTIRDYPEYGHRGTMLDVGRHFFGVDAVKRYIDFLVALKMNVMHLHLTEDQGWRIEIKSWPNLTAHGGSTEVGGGEGGFFTQEQYTEIVNYAAARHVLIIPEIDMPGHTNAALASYAELNCDGKATELYTGTEVGFSSLCVDKKITYEFINDVIGELAAITPGPYIHIGGDETHSTEKEDFIKFINQVKSIVESHGKIMLGWDETAQADLGANSVVQLWASPEFARMAVEKNAKIIMSPATKTYLDMQYDSTTHLGLHWAAYIEVDSSYIWSPETLIPGIGRENIIGIESPLWTETITNMDELEYMVFPRILSHAEIGWTPANMRSWDEFKLRLAQYGVRMEVMGIDFYRSKQVPWVTESNEQ